MKRLKIILLTIFILAFIISGAYIFYFPSLFVKKVPLLAESNLDYYVPQAVLKFGADKSSSGNKQLSYLFSLAPYLYGDENIVKAFIFNDVEFNKGLNVLPLGSNEQDVMKMASSEGYNFTVTEDGKYQLLYKRSDDEIVNFSAQRENNKITVKGESAAKTIYLNNQRVTIGGDIATEAEANITGEAVVKIKNNYFFLEKGNSNKELASFWLSRGEENNIELYGLKGKSTVLEQNFEDSADQWKTHLEDMSGGEGNASFKVYRTSDAASGKYAAQLKSDNHTAGLVRDLNENLNNNSIFSISFNYKNLSGQPAAFFVKEQSGMMTLISQDLPKSSNWQEYKNIFFSKNAQQGLELVLVSAGDNIFDNVKMESLDLSEANLLAKKKIDFPKEEWLQKEVPLLSDNTNKLTFGEPAPVEIFKQDFEDQADSWQTRMEDLSGGSGKADFKVERVPLASQGQYSVQLLSKSHSLGLIRTLSANLEDNAYYMLSFDYQYLKGDTPAVAVREAGKGTVFSQTLEKSEKWKNFSGLFLSPNAKTNGLEIILSVASKGSTSSTNFDNLKLTKMPLDVLGRLFLAKGNVEKLAVPEIAYKKLDTGIFEVEVKNATEQFLLVFTEQFHKDWQLTGAPAQHVEANTYSNAWIIEKTGNYKLKIEYVRRKIFTIATIVAVFSFVALIAVIVWMFLTRKKREKKA